MPRATKPKTKTKAKTTTAKSKPKAKPKVVAYTPADLEVEYPYDMFPWKLIFKDGTEKRTCYFQCEEHRKKHITRYNLNKKNILFMGYKFDE